MTQKSGSRIVRDARKRTATPELLELVREARTSLEFAIDDIKRLHDSTSIPAMDSGRINSVGAVLFEFRKWLAKYELDMTGQTVDEPRVTLT